MPTVHYVSRAVLEEEYGISGSSSDRDSATLLRRYVAAARPPPSLAVGRKLHVPYSPYIARE